MSAKIEVMFNYFLFEYFFLFFTNELSVQTALLHDFSTKQHLETALQCTVHGAYFKP